MTGQFTRTSGDSLAVGERQTVGKCLDAIIGNGGTAHVSLFLDTGLIRCRGFSLTLKDGSKAYFDATGNRVSSQSPALRQKLEENIGAVAQIFNTLRHSRMAPCSIAFARAPVLADTPRR